MKSKRFYLLTLLASLTFFLSFGAVFAQEATEEAPGDMVTCDADLILNLYIAERYFGFSSFNSELPSDMMIDVDSIDKGQLGALFDAIDPNASTLNISDTTRANMTDMMSMSDADFDAHMNGMIGDASATRLPMATVDDESEECAALRAALHRFFIVLAINDIEMMPVDIGGGTGAGGGDTDTGDTDTDDSDTGDSDTDDSDTGDTGSGDSDTGADTGSAGIVANLSGASEVPGPGDEDASGTATVYLRGNTNEVCVDIIVENITLPATAAHIHRGAAGESGPPVVPLNAPNESGVSNTCTTVDAALMTEMINDPQNFYVNVHNAEFPEGAARGQLTASASAGSDAGSSSGDSDTGDSGSDDSDSDSDTGDTTDDSGSTGIAVNLSGASEVPGPGDEDASGTATVYLRGNTNEVCVDISVQNITLPATAAHIHRGAAGESGPPVVTLTPPNESGVSNTCTTVDAALMQEMINDPQNFYVNIHNAEFPDGAARGQME